jgi:hypothetical protein
MTPLSDGERRDLAAMEAALASSDPDLAAAFNGRRAPPEHTRGRGAVAAVATLTAVAVVLLTLGTTYASTALLLTGGLAVTAAALCVLSTSSPGRSRP